MFVGLNVKLITLINNEEDLGCYDNFHNLDC